MPPKNGGTVENVTASRLFSPDTRSALILGLGIVLIVAPVALGLSEAAMVAGVAIGACVVGLGLAGTASGGRATIPIRAQASYDQGLALGLVLSALAFAVAGDHGPAMLFGLSGLVQVLVAATTRYSARPGLQDFL